MKKVLFVLFNYGCGGAETVLLNFIKYNKTSETPWDITLFALDNTGILYDDFKKYAKILTFGHFTNNRRLNEYILRIIINFKFLTNLCIFNNQDYDSTIAWLEGAPAKIVKNINKTKDKIAWIHTDINHYNTKTKQKYEKIYSKFNKIAFVSADIKAKFLEVYPKLCEKMLSVIYNPIDFEVIKQKSNEEIKDLVKNDFLTVISVGRFTFEKGMDRIIQIAKLCKDENITINFLLIGDGIELTKLKRTATELNLNNVTFLGYKKNPFPYIKESDIYLLPSRREGYPTCLCEALALEKPIISSNCTGVKEVLQKAGIIISNGEHLFVDEAFNALQKLKNKHELLYELQDASKKRAKEFNYKKQMSIIREYIGGEF